MKTIHSTKKNNQKDAVVAIIEKSDKFLFVKRAGHLENAPGYWCPVSGRVEKGEHQHETVKREVKEEVGLDVAAIEKICAIHSHDKRYLLNFWTTEILSGEATIMSEEIAALRWVTIEEMRQLVPVFEEDVQVFEQIKNRS